MMLSVQRINELEAENAELKAYKDVNEDFKNAWEELKTENKKLKQCLQEIKEILLQAMDVKSNAYNHFSKVEQAIDLITKAEEE